MPPINNVTTWRSSVYVQRSYLWLDNPPIVFQAQVNGAVTFPVSDIPYHNTTGSYSDTWRFQTVLFGSAPGLDDLGRGYLRKGTTNTTLYVGRMSQGNSDGTCNISDGSYITVIDQFRPWARIPFIADGMTDVGGVTPVLGSQFRDWDLGYSIGVNGSPQVNLGFGPGFANYGDPTNSDLLTMSFNAASYSKSYDSNISSYLWNVIDGTITSGSTTTVAITVTFPVGRRYIHLTATDGNGNQTTRHLLIVNCKDGTNFEPIKEFDVSKHDLDLSGNSGGFSVRVRQSIPRSTYPDQCNVIYWKEEFYNNVKGSQNVIGSLGQTGCESIKFSGWHFTDNNSTNAQSNGYINEVTLNCLDVTGWLNQLPGFSIEVDRTTSPTSWLQMKSSNMDKYFAEGILYYFSTARFITDWYDTNTGDMYAFSRLGSGEATLYQQIQELADRAIGYEFTSNEQGMMFVRANQNLLLSSNRTNTNIITLTEDDITSINYVHQRFPKQHWNRGAYILVSTSDAQVGVTPQTSFWVAPGRAPGQGSESKDYNEQLAFTSTEASIRTANRYAEDNIDFGDIEIVLREPGDAGIDPAYGQWITLNISSTYAAQRDLNFTNTRLRVISVSWAEQSSNYGHVSTQKIIGRIETNGTSSQDDTPPISNVAPPPPVAPPPVTPPLSGSPTHNGSTVIALSDTALGYTTSFNSTPPTYLAISHAGITGTFFFMLLDPYSPFLTTQTGSIYAWVFTTTGIFYSETDILTAPSWSHVFTWTGIVGLAARASTTTSGVLFVNLATTSHIAYQLSGHGSVTDWSVALSDVDAAIDIDHYGTNEALVGNGHIVSRIIAGVKTDLPFTYPDRINFIQKPLVTLSGVANSSTSGSECFYVATGAGGSNLRLFVTTDGGTTATEITPSGGVGVSSQYSSMAFTNDAKVLVAWGSGAGGITTLFTSNDGGVTWIALSTSLGAVTAGYFPRLNPTYMVYAGTQSPAKIVLYSFGGSLQDKTGNWVSVLGSATFFGSVIPLF